MENTEIFAVVVCYNGSNGLLKTVDALHGKVGHINIVDNASAVETLNVLNSLENRSNISVTYLSENKGIGFALNSGMQKAIQMGYNWLLTMDQDSVVDHEMIPEFCKAINKDVTLCCLAPSINVFDKENSFNSKQNKDGTIDYAITSGNLVRLSVFKTIGKYNEELFIDCVDFDFSLRVREAGFKIHIVPTARLYHELGEEHDVPGIFSWFYTSHSPLRRYYMYRNWGYMMQHFFLKFPALILKSTIIHVLLLMVVPFYDKNPKKSLKFIYFGMRDYLRNQYGPLKI